MSKSPNRKLFNKIPTICGYIKLLDIMPNTWESEELCADEAVITAARTSTDKGLVNPKKDAKLLMYLWENKHMTPFEMVDYKFEIVAPLFVAVQWLRHRTGSFNMMSARYIEIEESFYNPTLRLQDLDNKQSSKQSSLQDNTIEYHSKKAYQAYKNLLHRGCARELARSVLPQNVNTKFVWKVNLRNLLHFIELRNDPHAQLEIRDPAQAIYSVVQELNPVTSAAYETFNYITLSRPEVRAIHDKESLIGNKRQKRHFEQKLKELGL